MLGVSTEKGRDLLGDSYFNFILLKPMVKKRDTRVWARFTVMKRSSSIKKNNKESSDKLDYQLLTKCYSIFSQITVSRS